MIKNVTSLSVSIFYTFQDHDERAIKVNSGCSDEGELMSEAGEKLQMEKLKSNCVNQSRQK